VRVKFCIPPLITVIAIQWQFLIYGITKARFIPVVRGPSFVMDVVPYCECLYHSLL
jgi:hypothetical protein